MYVYQRSRTELLKGLLYTLGGGLSAYVIAAILGAGQPVRIIAAVVVLGLLGALFQWGEAIRVEITSEGQFTFYQAGRPKHTLALANYTVTRSRRMGRNGKTIGPDRTLAFTPKKKAKEEEKPLTLDLTPLGNEQFLTLCKAILFFTTGNMN